MRALALILMLACQGGISGPRSDADPGTLGADTAISTGWDGDSDDDGLSDDAEIFLGTLPDDPDTDNDGLGDGAEHHHGLDPKAADTDGDGLDDGDEVALGSDPLDPGDPPPATDTGSTQGTPPTDTGPSTGEDPPTEGPDTVPDDTDTPVETPDDVAEDPKGGCDHTGGGSLGGWLLLALVIRGRRRDRRHPTGAASKTTT